MNRREFCKRVVAFTALPAAVLIGALAEGEKPITLRDAFLGKGLEIPSTWMDHPGTWVVQENRR